MTAIRVVVGDDHPVYREGVVRALSRSGRFVVVAEAADGQEALNAIRQHVPDVAVLDYRMPALDGVDVAHAVLRDQIPTRILILTAFNASSTIYSALSEGVTGFLAKDSTPDEIVSAVTSCSKGEGVLPSGVALGLAGEIRDRSTENANILTEREMQVMRLIAAGKSVPQMASALFLAPTTIKSHVQRIYEKLGVSDRGSAVAAAMRRRLIE